MGRLGARDSFRGSRARDASDHRVTLRNVLLEEVIAVSRGASDAPEAVGDYLLQRAREVALSECELSEILDALREHEPRFVHRMMRGGWRDRGAHARSLADAIAADANRSPHRLPTTVRSQMEGALGVDLSEVEVYEDQKASALGALAYTRGDEVVFAPGHYRPDTDRGLELLGHELVHVVQQRAGRVRPAAQGATGTVDSDPVLEAEADRLGARAARGERVAMAMPVAGQAQVRLQLKPAGAGPEPGRLREGAFVRAISRLPEGHKLGPRLELELMVTNDVVEDGETVEERLFVLKYTEGFAHAYCLADNESGARLVKGNIPNETLREVKRFLDGIATRHTKDQAARAIGLATSAVEDLSRLVYSKAYRPLGSAEAERQHYEGKPADTARPNDPGVGLDVTAISGSEDVMTTGTTGPRSDPPPGKDPAPDGDPVDPVVPLETQPDTPGDPPSRPPTQTPTVTPKPPSTTVTESQITLDDTIQFDLDQATILPESLSLVDAVAQRMREHPELERVQVEGHTDPTGKPGHNLDLSKRRAASVRDALVARGVFAERLTTTGHGDTRPLPGVDKKSKKDHARLRRVEFRIVKRGPAKPADKAVQRRAHGEVDVHDPVRVAARGVAHGGDNFPYFERIQEAFGDHDLGTARAHLDQDAITAARELRAEAYARGEHVAFARSPDLRTAAHEAAHIVQQRHGVSLAGGVGRVGDTYERHADAVADRVVRGQSAEDLLDAYVGRASTSTSTSAVQRWSEHEHHAVGDLAAAEASPSAELAVPVKGGDITMGDAAERSGDYAKTPQALDDLGTQSSSFLRMVWIAGTNINHFFPLCQNEYRAHHQKALAAAVDGDRGTALREEGFASHFLADCFAAGHQTPRALDRIHAEDHRAEDALHGAAIGFKLGSAVPGVGGAAGAVVGGVVGGTSGEHTLGLSRSKKYHDALNALASGIPLVGVSGQWHGDDTMTPTECQFIATQAARSLAAVLRVLNKDTKSPAPPRPEVPEGPDVGKILADKKKPAARIWRHMMGAYEDDLANAEKRSDHDMLESDGETRSNTSDTAKKIRRQVFGNQRGTGARFAGAIPRPKDDQAAPKTEAQIVKLGAAASKRSPAASTRR